MRHLHISSFIQMTVNRYAKTFHVIASILFTKLTSIIEDSRSFEIYYKLCYELSGTIY